jgi:Holliday junction DNA helicase RuvB
VGLGTVAVSVQEDQDTVEDVVEPYLIRLGLLARTPRGRMATAGAYRQLGLAVPSGVPGAAASGDVSAQGSLF